MGDVDAIYRLECAHRRQLRAARGLPFPRTKTIRDVSIDDLIILSVLHFSDVHVDSSPIEVQRADVLYDFLQITFWQVRQYTLRRVLERTPGWRFIDARIPCCTPSFGHAQHDARRCCRGKSDAPAAPPSEGGHSPSLPGAMHSPASTCLTLQPPRCLQADDVE